MLPRVCSELHMDVALSPIHELDSLTGRYPQHRRLDGRRRDHDLGGVRAPSREQHKIGEPVGVTVWRNGETLTLRPVPEEYR